jgi:hypothetical protein
MTGSRSIAEVGSWEGRPRALTQEHRQAPVGAWRCKLQKEPRDA